MLLLTWNLHTENRLREEHNLVVSQGQLLCFSCRHQLSFQTFHPNSLLIHFPFPTTEEIRPTREVDVKRRLVAEAVRLSDQDSCCYRRHGGIISNRQLSVKYQDDLSHFDIFLCCTPQPLCTVWP
jgi:hypothetical protein